jgi:hypothetical protein
MANTEQKELESESKKEARPSRKKTRQPRCARKGVRILREEAGKAVGKNSKKLAESLLVGALKGNLNSTKLLLSLAELQSDPEVTDKNLHGLSLAQSLAAEPEWKEPPDETTAETTGRGREPEG